jgi:DNA-directed RNA polymerase subunit delta
MKIRKKSIDELELMSYTDIAYEIIKEDKKQYNTPSLFKEVCDLLNLSNEEFEEKIGDFFTALTTDKRFILIDSINWDLKENHKVNVVIDNGDEEDISSEEINEDEELEDDSLEESEEDDYSDESIDDSQNAEEDIQELTIIDEDDLEE